MRCSITVLAAVQCIANTIQAVRPAGRILSSYSVAIQVSCFVCVGGVYSEYRQSLAMQANQLKQESVSPEI